MLISLVQRFGDLYVCTEQNIEHIQQTSVQVS